MVYLPRELLILIFSNLRPMHIKGREPVAFVCKTWLSVEQKVFGDLYFTKEDVYTTCLNDLDYALYALTEKQVSEQFTNNEKQHLLAAHAELIDIYFELYGLDIPEKVLRDPNFKRADIVRKILSDPIAFDRLDEEKTLHTLLKHFPEVVAEVIDDASVTHIPLEMRAIFSEKEAFAYWESMKCYIPEIKWFQDTSSQRVDVTRARSLYVHHTQLALQFLEKDLVPVSCIFWPSRKINPVLTVELQWAILQKAAQKAYRDLDLHFWLYLDENVIATLIKDPGEISLYYLALAAGRFPETTLQFLLTFSGELSADDLTALTQGSLFAARLVLTEHDDNLKIKHIARICGDWPALISTLFANYDLSGLKEDLLCALVSNSPNAGWEIYSRKVLWEKLTIQQKVCIALHNTKVAAQLINAIKDQLDQIPKMELFYLAFQYYKVKEMIFTHAQLANVEFGQKFFQKQYKLLEQRYPELYIRRDVSEYQKPILLKYALVAKRYRDAGYPIDKEVKKTIKTSERICTAAKIVRNRRMR